MQLMFQDPCKSLRTSTLLQVSVSPRLKPYFRAHNIPVSTLITSRCNENKNKKPAIAKN